MHPESATRPTEGDFAWRLGEGDDRIAPRREAFQSWLGQSPASDDDVADLAVVLSELAANALACSTPAPDGTRAEIRAGLDGDHLWLEVANRVPDAADVLRWDLADPLRGGGRGLMIVRAYTDTMAVDSTGGRVTVRCTRRLEHGG